MRHTPGPWMVHTDGTLRCAVRQSDGAAIAQGFVDPDGDADPRFICGVGIEGSVLREDLANAALIARAPDMLLALRGLMTADTDAGHALANDILRELAPETAGVLSCGSALSPQERAEHTKTARALLNARALTSALATPAPPRKESR